MSVTFSRAPALLPDAIVFQGVLEEIVAEPAPHWMRRANFLLAGGFVALLLTASLAQVDIVVTASGALAADQPTIVVQPMERAIIRELRVKPGDAVRKGDVLATLDPTFSQSSLDSHAAQQRALSATIRRQVAELQGEAPFTAIGSTQQENPDAALQETIYRERLAQYAARLANIDATIQRGEANYRTAEQDGTALGNQVLVARELEAMRAKLFASQIGSKLLFLESQAGRLRAEREYQSAYNRLTELRHEIDARRAERRAFIGTWRTDLMQDIARTRAELTKVEDALTKAARLHQLIVLTAPEDAVVLDIAPRSAGSVLREAEPLITLLPANAGLIADTMVESQDVGYVRAGDPVVIKVDAFPYQRHGTLRGTVRAVGQASVANDRRAERDPAINQPGRFHRMQVVIGRAALAGLPDGARLTPGMTMMAEVKVGVRSALSYFLTPITRGFDETLREP